MRTRLMPFVAAAALLALPACRVNERLSGTVIGGVGGAALGAAAGGVGGAFIGGGAGAITGYMVGDYIADQRERGRRSVFGDDSDDGPGGTQMASWRRSPITTSVAGARESVAQATYERGRRSLSAAEARALFQEAVRLDPSHTPSWNALGINAAMRGDRVEAERCFQAALRFDPGNADARWHLDRLRAAR